MHKETVCTLILLRMKLYFILYNYVEDLNITFCQTEKMMTMHASLL